MCHGGRRAARTIRERRVAMDGLLDNEVIERYRLPRKLIYHLEELLLLHDDLVLTGLIQYPITMVGSWLH